MSVIFDIDMPKACIEYHKENDESIYCPIYNSCKQRLTINLNGKSVNCPLSEIDDDIRVGDEVTIPYTHTYYVVTGINDNDLYMMKKNGDCAPVYYNKTDVRKTGRRFPQIAEVLERMRGEE